MTEVHCRERSTMISSSFESDGDQSLAWYGKARRGMAGQAKSRPGMARQDKVVCCRSGVLQQDRGGFTALVHIFNLVARLGRAWLGRAGPGMAGHGKARTGIHPPVSLSRGGVGPGLVWQGRAGQGLAWPDKARAGVYLPHSFYKSLQSRLGWLEHREPMSMTRK